MLEISLGISIFFQFHYYIWYHVEDIKWPEIKPWSGDITKESMNYVLQVRKNFCANPDSHLVAMVFTTPGNHERRTILRNTWGSPNAQRHYLSKFGMRMSIIFVSGYTENEIEMEAMKAEHELHQDIIQGNFADSYRNLTFKYVFAMKWASEYCSQVQYLVRTNDDIFVNGFNLFQLLKHYEKKGGELRGSFFICRHERLAIQRNRYQKWYNSYDDYPYNWYPRTCYSHGVVMAGKMAPMIYKRSLSSKYFWHDDVFIPALVFLNVKDISYLHIKALMRSTTLELEKGSRFRRRNNLDAVFIHLVEMSVFVQYEWWAQVLKRHGLMTREEQELLEIAS